VKPRTLRGGLVDLDDEAFDAEALPLLESGRETERDEIRDSANESEVSGVAIRLVVLGSFGVRVTLGMCLARYFVGV
jgi:hypothetical protein